jgi:UDPglucose--hexose-1-phosphate uridylyltransferase
MSELRKDIITGRWIIISTVRGKRPHTTQAPKIEEDISKQCPFCVGNESMTPPEIYALRDPLSHRNGSGWKVRVVPNKFPALGIDQELSKKGVGIYDMMAGYGAHEVVIETPHHNRAIKDQDIEEITNVLTVIQDRVEDLHRDMRMRYILVFRNEGYEAGASISHPHTQIIATPVTPKRVREELQGAEAYYKLKERCVICDIIQEELDKKVRLVFENEGYLAFCPYASRFPFEIWILPKTHGIDFYAREVRKSVTSLAICLKTVMQKLANALNNPQYNYIIHTAPNRFPRRGYWKTIEDDFHWHIEIMPRLTRVAGFEWGSGFYICPTPPEEAARYLREVKV